MIKNIGFHEIQVNGGTLYGKFKGNNKDLVLLMVAGSGPTDMNGNTPLIEGRNDSFLQLATALSQKGISTFRYDKRTAGRSVDTFENIEADFNIFVDDLKNVINYLKEQGYKKVIIMGHSKGSLVGMLSADQEPVDGFISVAGSGFPVDITLEKQLLPHFGENSEEIRVIQTLRQGKIDTSLDAHPQFSILNQKFLLTWMKHNPAQVINQLKIPTLLLQGDSDTQVTEDDLNSLQAGKKDAQSVLIKGMNHVLKKVSNEEENIKAYTDPSYPLHDELVPIILEFLHKF